MFRIIIDNQTDGSNEKTVCFAGCTLSFERSQSGTFDFGKKVCFIIPQHGDFNCCCQPCSVYHFVNKEQENGWRLCNITVDNDESKKDKDDKKQIKSNCFS